jgi:hypothetical protein
MKRKTLHDIKAPGAGREASGAIPHVFHRHGKLNHYAKTHVQDKTGTLYFPIQTDSERLTAYGAIAAGDAMVVPNKNGTDTLRIALQTAVGHRLMAPMRDGPYGMAPVWGQQETSYFSALEALRQYGSANQENMLGVTRKLLRTKGLKHQANILEPMIRGAIDMALDFDHAGLDWFYREFHSLYGTDEKPNPESNDKGPPVVVPEPWGIALPGPGKGESGVADWGPMSIRKAPMTPWKHPRIRSRASWKYSEFGVFKYPWRALPSSDYRCFSVKRRQYGGTLLIDMSGSMSIDQYEVDQILNMAPYATIACYGSTHGEKCQSGRLVIIAQDMQKGETAAARSRIGIGNVVDGPALQWLAKQDGPRIWISDGGVTGIGDTGSPACRYEAAAICHAGRIIQIGTLAELIAKLQ